VKIRLDSARFEPFRWQESVVIPVAELGRPGLLTLAPAEVDGALTYADPAFLLDLGLASRATIECDRCLKPVEFELAGRVQLMVVGSERRERETEHEERELEEGELGVLELAGELFESVPLVREQLLLELPAKPLCREECAGLCPTCGADLNLGPCGCARRAIDPRWAALEVVRSKLEDRS